MLRLNPFVVQLQTVLLEESLRPLGLTPQDLISVNGRRRISPKLMKNKFPKLLDFMEKESKRFAKEQDVSIWAMNVMLSYFPLDERVLRLLKDCEECNRALRNPAAHELFAITNAHIQNICGLPAENLVWALEKVLTNALARYAGKELKKRINIYDYCDRIIQERLRL